MTRLKAVEAGPYEEWSELSDHSPISAAFE